MPELPEVEVVVRSLQSLLQGSSIKKCVFRRKDIREPIPIAEVQNVLLQETVLSVFRRSKYIIVETAKGRVFFHLGMTGKMVYRSGQQELAVHTHVSFEVQGGSETFYLDFVDPRRFGRIGAMLGRAALESHPFFADLGPEPLVHRQLGKHLFQASRNKKTAVKSFIMDAHVVVGVGNIYASESLFRANLHPLSSAQALSATDYEQLAKAIKSVLREAIRAGGTTLRDFRSTDGTKGYFLVSLQVYDQTGKPCPKCHHNVQMQTICGRSSFFCSHCQIRK